MVTDWFESLEVEGRVDALLGSMSLEDKVRLVSGQLSADRAGNIPPMPQGVPQLLLADGPAGVRIYDASVNERRATALPAPIALAATWDEELARRYGHLMGEDANAAGVNVLLGPAVDIARAPLGGRTFESFGEDPLLASRLVVPEVRAVQAHAVLACIKHYIVNNQEYQRDSVDVQVDERTLHELYLPAFAAAVEKAHIAAVMGSYNRINGTYACENSFTLTSLLRDELGFRGFVMSDYLANHTTLQSAGAGLEWELGTKMWGGRLLEAVQSGEMPGSLLDEMVRRILRPVLGLGLAEHPRVSGGWKTQEHAQTAREIAERGVVLLKNAGPVLPLDAQKVTSIAVIGVDADTVSAAGGGSACVRPARAVSLLDGIKQRVGAAVSVTYSPGVDPLGPGALLPGPAAIPSGFFVGGVQVSYYDHAQCAGEPLIRRLEPRIEFNYGFPDIFAALQEGVAKFLFKPADMTVRLAAVAESRLHVPLDGEYAFSLTCLGVARLYLDGALVLDTASAVALAHTGNSQASVYAVRVHLSAADALPLRVEYSSFEAGALHFNPAMLRLGWVAPAGVTDPAMAQACAVARDADVVIMAARTYETEEIDRPLMTLPDHQDALIRALAAANPNIIVVLMSGSPVEVAGWEDVVPAVLEAWYAGQEQGSAIARVLFGDVNPSGRLPLTFPRNLQQTPLISARQYPGEEGRLYYSEGLFSGYRGYERLGLQPQYPFGYGLSYTSFAYRNLELTPPLSDGTEKITLSFEISNTGDCAGVETAQVYLGLPQSAQAPLKRLAGWAQVSLGPGETKRVTVCLDPQDGYHVLSHWDADAHAWQTATGEYLLFVGASVSDIRLQALFNIARR